MGAGAKNKAGRGPGWLDPRVTYQDYLGDLGDDEDGGDDDHLIDWIWKIRTSVFHFFWTLSLCEPYGHQLIKSLGGLLLFDDSEHLVVDRVLGPQPKKQGSLIVASQLTMSDHLFWTSC